MKRHQYIAKRIAKHLFTNGANERATRLVLQLPDGRDGGGWCEKAVRDSIARMLAELGSIDEGTAA